MRFIILLITMMLSVACNTQKANFVKPEVISDWERIEFPLEDEIHSIGSLDSEVDDLGRLHLAFTTKTYLQGMQSYDYQMIYALYDGSRFEFLKLKRSTRRFYYVRGGNNQNSFLRIHISKDRLPIVVYLNEENELIHGEYSSHIFSEKVIDTSVGTFTSSYQPNEGRLSFAYMGIYPEAKTLKYRLVGKHSREYRSISLNFNTSVEAPPHLELLYHNGEPLIITKVVNQATGLGEMMLFKENSYVTLATGIDVGVVYNAFLNNDILRSCYRTTDGTNFNLDYNISDSKKKSVTMAGRRNSGRHCLVSSDPKHSFITYNNYTPYNDGLITSESIDVLNLEEIKQLEEENSNLIAGGLDPISRRPVIMLKKR